MKSNCGQGTCLCKFHIKASHLLQNNIILWIKFYQHPDQHSKIQRFCFRLSIWSACAHNKEIPLANWLDAKQKLQQDSCKTQSTHTPWGLFVIGTFTLLPGSMIFASTSAFQFPKRNRHHMLRFTITLSLISIWSHQHYHQSSISISISSSTIIINNLHQDSGVEFLVPS